MLLTEALFEAFFVVLGVILALSANEWRQNQAAKAKAESALQEIHDELASNMQLVEEAVE